jgi:3-hydroxyisobutyrate dehydrogenase-like beta-hydroxyacid dehydrogenase
LFGPQGAASALHASAWIDCSTTGPDAFLDLARRLPAGVTAIDAPVLGSVPQATEGSLQIFVGAAPEVLARWTGVLSALGRPIHAGPMGAGAALKLVANSTLGALMTALGEALALADAFHLDTKTVLDVLENSPIGVTTRAKRALVESGEYPARFRLALAAKDMRLVNAAAAARHVDLQVARTAQGRLEDATAAHLGDLDYSAVIAHIRHRPAR